MVTRSGPETAPKRPGEWEEEMEDKTGSWRSRLLWDEIRFFRRTTAREEKDRDREREKPKRRRRRGHEGC